MYQVCSSVQIIMSSWNNGAPTPVFNNAAQVWNHTFFWEGMAPNAGGLPSGDLAAAIDKSFGSFDTFKEQFAAAGATQFGSGWAWLVAAKDGSLEIIKSPNAVNTMVEGTCTACIVSRFFFVCESMYAGHVLRKQAYSPVFITFPDRRGLPYLRM